MNQPVKKYRTLYCEGLCRCGKGQFKWDNLFLNFFNFGKKSRSVSFKIKSVCNNAQVVSLNFQAVSLLWRLFNSNSFKKQSIALPDFFPRILKIRPRTLTSQLTGCSLNIVFFPLNVVIFLNSASSAAALVFYLPFSGLSMKSGVHNKEKPREARGRNIFWNFRKNTIFD